MCATLFGDQIKAYDEAIAYNGEYKISNATVRPIDDQYRSTHDQLPYQLHFNHRTVVQPVCTETGYVVPLYQSIALIPKLEVADERYGTASDALNFWAEKFTFVGFTSLKHNPRRAFALLTTMSTRIIHNPKGDSANMLREWVAFKFEVVDVTGSMTLTSFNNDTEKMFGRTAAEIKTMKDCGDVFGFQEIEEKLRKKTTFLKLGPSNSLGSSSVLEWSLKTIDISDDVPKKGEAQISVVRNAQSENSDPNNRETYTPTKHQRSNVDIINEDTPDSKAKDKGKEKISEIPIPNIPISSKGIVITDEEERVVKDSTILTAETVRTPKLSTAEWIDLCRTRLSGTKHSLVTPTPIGDTKSSLDHHKSTLAKKLRFTTPEKTESKNDEVAEKKTEE
uniref:Uncharacterized protein n=1 Tax=Chenopodium quinoa TaxID=63459 RepID=A0A803MZ79_CHEQI